MSDYTPEQQEGIKEFWEWVETRPAIIQEMCRDKPQFKKYMLKQTGQIVWIYSYSENRTVTVNIYPEDQGDNFLMVVPRQVFGINPDDLEVAA